MFDLQAMKDTLIAIERETYNITAIIVRLLQEQNTLIELQAIKTSLLAIEDKTDILATISTLSFKKVRLLEDCKASPATSKPCSLKWNGETPQHNAVRHKANPPCNSHTSLVKRHSNVVASNTITDINPSLKPICNTIHCKANPP